MSIKIQMQDGKGNIIHPESDASIIRYKDETAESNLEKLNDRLETFVQQEEPDKDCFWIDTTDIIVDEENSNENLITKQIKKYIDNNVVTKYDKEIKELTSKDEILSNEISKIANPNLLINGDFQINQHGLTSLTTNGYLADRWYITKDSQETDGTIEHRNREIILSNAKEDLSTSHMYLSQRFDSKDLSTFTGKTITFSADCKCESLTKGSYFLQIIYDCQDEDQNQDVDSRRIIKLLNNSNMTTEYTRHYISLAIPYNIKAIAFQIGYYYDEIYGGIVNQSAKFYMTNLKAELGNTPTPFIPKTYAQELQDCLIYNGDDITIPYSNPNLLINGDFRNPVNQRGKSEYTEHNKYTIDRWRLCSGGQNGTLIKNDGYITLKNATADNTYLQYMLDSDAKLLEGETITFSIMYKGTANCRLNAFGENDVLLTHTDSWTVKTLTINLTSWTYSLGQVESSILLQFYDMDTQAFTEGSLDIKWVKLELGTSATPLVSRSFGEELALCQRYYEKSDGDTIIQGFKGGNNDYELEWKYLVEKRVSPTITYGNAGASAENNLYIITPNHMVHMSISAPNRISEKLVRFVTPKIDSDINSFGTSVQATGWFIADAEIY